MVYFLVAFLACMLGALAGLGGGVIIKPVLQTVTDLSLSNISILSTFTVFAMATTSLIKRRVNNNLVLIENVLWLVIGSVLGGVIGSNLFNMATQNVADITVVENVQSMIIIVLLLVALNLKSLRGRLNLKLTKVSLFLIGGFLSILSAFLGIGGGPINVAILVIFLNLELKLAMATSIVIIFFAQGSNIITLFSNQALVDNNLYPLLLMIPAAIVGSTIGTKLVTTLSTKHVGRIYNVALIIIILLNVNIIIN